MEKIAKKSLKKLLSKYEGYLFSTHLYLILEQINVLLLVSRFTVQTSELAACLVTQLWMKQFLLLHFSLKGGNFLRQKLEWIKTLRPVEYFYILVPNATVLFSCILPIPKSFEGIILHCFTLEARITSFEASQNTAFTTAFATLQSRGVYRTFSTI